MKILFAASECVPFCKTGGLADVLGALPKELRKKRHDIRVVLPKYKTIRAQEFGLKDTGKVVHVPIGDRIETGQIFTARTDKGVQVYFIAHEGYFGRPGLYQSPEGEYPDNAERFIFFSRAVLEVCKAMEFKPDVIHCHDWQAGLIPAYLRLQKPLDAYFHDTASVFTIHNIAYQGAFPKSAMLLSGIPWSEFTMQKLEFYDQLCFMKAGLIYSDALTTVSPTYAREIQTPAFGWGMEGVLRGREKDLSGILNGIDLEEWDPAHDPFLAKPFDVRSRQSRKDCKAYLQQNLKLPKAPRTPLLGMVARIAAQKGVDLLVPVIAPLIAEGVQIVILGQGDAPLVAQLQQFESRFPRNFRFCTDFNEPLAHHIYGGSDLFLMPSRFEPCGLGQMISMRYGSIPVVMNTGGLADTVVPVGREETGNGFVFYEPTPEALQEALDRALKLYAQESDWSRLQDRAMHTLFSWEGSAEKYLDIYRRAVGRGQNSKRSVRAS